MTDNIEQSGQNQLSKEQDMGRQALTRVSDASQHEPAPAKMSKSGVPTDESSKAKPPIKRRNSTLSRRKLLEAAISEFSARGPHATTLDDICSVAGLNKRLVYHYYGDKQALYTAALKYVYSQFFSLEVELGAMLLPVEQLLIVLVERYYIFLRDHPSFLRMISFENLDGGKTAATLNLAGQKAPVITALRLAIEKGKADGNFSLDIDVNQLLVDIFALCYFYYSNSATMNMLLGKDVLSAGSVPDRINHVVKLLLHGILHEDYRPRNGSSGASQ